MGAYHSSELPLVFGTFNDFRGVGLELERKTSVAMQDAWVGFVRGGIEGLRSVGWGEYRSGQATVREFGGQGVAVGDVDMTEMERECI